MVFVKGGLHITELPPSWEFQQRPFDWLFVKLPCYLLMLLVTSAYADTENTVACPGLSPNNEIFSAEKIYKKSIIAIEKGDDAYPINLVLYRPDRENCKKTIVAKYPHNGSHPIVDAVFFEKTDGQINLFTIVHWEINHRGAGTFGNLYQVYAYKKGTEFDLLVENKSITEDGMMTGMDGYEDGKEATFNYKTATAIIRYLRKK
ncbi:hypothetical protein [Cupriavidus sp. AcVe19-6a]|uniref:hypothetical protein n=1 Tax=Cupriavidus sp. AcVe19-6a TaxID=2821358 RepID=UPI001AE69136|nr:hypothetical protein [Cupriavidus sp. AcVe19-6a]MBP0634211.1 hypothetical protein [Cupriavidus sp. AcVe19-6a]